MVASIQISQSVYERLQSHATPFVDTPETVIIRALDALDAVRSPVDRPSTSPAPVHRKFDSQTPPNLTHTKLMSATLDGKAIDRPRWNGLLDACLVIGRNRAGSFQRLSTLTSANLFNGPKDDDGYHFLPMANLSVQGQDANGAWRSIEQLSRNLGISIEVVFYWRPKPGAEFPGEYGHMSV